MLDEMADLYVPEAEAPVAYILHWPGRESETIRSHGDGYWTAFPDPSGPPQPAHQVGAIDAGHMSRSGRYLVIGSGVWSWTYEPRYMVVDGELEPVSSDPRHDGPGLYFRADDFESAYATATRNRRQNAAIETPDDKESLRSIEVL